MNIKNIAVGETYSTGRGDIDLVKVVHIFFNEDWDEWCIQAKSVNAPNIGDKTYTFLPDDLEAVS